MNSNLSKNRDIVETIHQTSMPQYDGLGFKLNNDEFTVNGKTFKSIFVLGRKDNVYTTKSSTLPLFLGGEFVYLPPSDTLLQISSDSVNDTDGGSHAHQVFIVGINDKFERIVESLTLNGLTPVSTNQSFFRVGGMLVIDSSAQTQAENCNDGNIYIAQNGVTTTLGVPDKSFTLGVMPIGSGLSYSSCFSVPPGVQLFFSEITMSSSLASNKDDVIILEILVRTGNSGFKRLFRFSSTLSQPEVNIHQGSFPNVIFTPDPTAHTDICLVVYRLGGAGTSDDVLFSSYLTGHYVTDAN